GQDDEPDKEKLNPNGAFSIAFEAVRSELANDFNEWREKWSADEKIWFSNEEMLEAAILESVPKARPFKFVEQYFYETFKTLSGKTKSIVLLTVSNFLFSLLQDP